VLKVTAATLAFLVQEVAEDLGAVGGVAERGVERVVALVEVAHHVREDAATTVCPRLKSLRVRPTK
jgi:hypothetical protein